MEVMIIYDEVSSLGRFLGIGGGLDGTNLWWIGRKGSALTFRFPLYIYKFLGEVSSLIVGIDADASAQLLQGCTMRPYLSFSFFSAGRNALLLN